jgi:hypothetical protein
MEISVRLDGAATSTKTTGLATLDYIAVRGTMLNLIIDRTHHSPPVLATDACEFAELLLMLAGCEEE